MPGKPCPGAATAASWRVFARRGVGRLGGRFREGRRMTRTMSRLAAIGPRLTVSGVLTLALILAEVSAAQDADMSRRIRERMQQIADQGQIAGSVTLVGRGDRIASLEAVGRRSLEDDLPMRPDTLFRI